MDNLYHIDFIFKHLTSIDLSRCINVKCHTDFGGESKP